jgi:hypothetical protein
MDTFRKIFVITLLLQAGSVQAADEASIDGKWFRYPGQVDPVELQDIDAPEPVPDPPLKPEYREAWREERARLQEAEASGRPLATGYTRCLPDGMPAMMQGMFPMEVLESRGQVTIIQEAYNQVRRIYLGEELIPFDEAEPRFWGHSVGQWEGDTLVIETVGIKDYVEFRNVPHSSQMRISERIRLLRDNVMEDRVTVTDPVYLDGPWEWRWMYVREPEYKLYEYVCEDNREYIDETGAARLRLFGAEE